jgi:glycosyltransferase involved in cell wall biosynthesis
VTPSFNQGTFIEETIRSVLLQGYPDLEYFVIDGGSTDDSVDIIKKYSPWIARWTSGPDKGQSDAINRGLASGTGLFATWINSDDMLHRNAIFAHASRIGFDAACVYVGMCAYLDTQSNVQIMHRSKVKTLEDLLRVPRVWRKGGNIVQPEVLFPRDLALQVGGVSTNNHYTMDYELWGKFLLADICFQETDVPFGMYRRHPAQKTSDGHKVTQSLLTVALRLVDEAQHLPLRTKDSIRAELETYLHEYPSTQWRNSGRLAKWGLPRSLVVGIRALKQRSGCVRRSKPDGHDRRKSS